MLPVQLSSADTLKIIYSLFPADCVPKVHLLVEFAEESKTIVRDAMGRVAVAVAIAIGAGDMEPS